ncbi:hypothetical protein [Thiorhodospira sibirica]|uniref:hypothetical protein n=1 Tax=Thiorhodospira sibirica TaxID=154347 RepID=UPI00022C287C|nr:hypothetical protein [Thiorhodospira sibirica]
MDSLLSGILGALIGVLLGHRLAIALYKQRAKYIEKAFYNEFEIIRDDFIHWFPRLAEEYREPLKDEYSGPGTLDLKLVESLVVELAGTDKIISPDQRMLLSRLDRMIDNIKRKDQVRDAQIKKWIEHGEAIEKSERIKVRNEITFRTGELLVDTAQGIYFLSKLVEERDKFTIVRNGSILSFFEYSCRVCDMEFNENDWSFIIERLGLN